MKPDASEKLIADPNAGIPAFVAPDPADTPARYAKRPARGRFAYLAERGGFEPPVRYKRTPDFESGTFNHSATSPKGLAAMD
jgi:hypothetical protein